MRLALMAWITTDPWPISLSHSIISTLFHQRQGKSNNCSWATWQDVPARSSSNGLFRGTNASSLCHKAGSRSRWDLTDHPCTKKCPLGRKMWGVVLIPKPAAQTKDRAYTRGLTAARKRFKWIDVTRFNILVSKKAMIVYSALWFLACNATCIAISYFRSFSTLACRDPALFGCIAATLEHQNQLNPGMAGSALHQRLCATLARCILTAGRFWVTGRTASKPTLRSGSCANQSPTWSHSEATNSCILREFKSFCQIFSPTSTFDIGNLSVTDETLSSRIGRRLPVTPTLFEQKSVTGASHKMSQESICKWWCLYLNPLTSYFSTVKWKAGMALDRPVEKRINCYLRNSSRGKQMLRGMEFFSAEGSCGSRNLDFWNVWRPYAFQNWWISPTAPQTQNICWAFLTKPSLWLWALVIQRLYRIFRGIDTQSLKELAHEPSWSSWEVSRRWEVAYHACVDEWLTCDLCEMESPQQKDLAPVET